MALQVRALIVAAGLILFGAEHSYAVGGIQTCRLSRGDQRIWDSIRAIVLAQDGQGRPTHPRLYDLWCKLEASGHTVFIELIERQPTYSSQAGRFSLETLDTSGKHHTCVIRLNLCAIRRASSSVMRPDGSIPMQGLGNIERYAEVLGHEMAHAVGILLDPDYLHLYEDLDKANAAYERQLKSPNRVQADLEMQSNRIQALHRALEMPAEAAETEIWRELIVANRHCRRTAMMRSVH